MLKVYKVFVVSENYTINVSLLQNIILLLIQIQSSKCKNQNYNLKVKIVLVVLETLGQINQVVVHRFQP